MKKTIIIFCIAISLLLFSSCSTDSKIPDPFRDKLLSPKKWNAVYTCDQNGKITVFLENTSEEVITVFRYALNDRSFWLVQEKTAAGWETIIPDDGPSTDLLIDDRWVHVAPGEKVELEAAYRSWAYHLEKGDKARLLLAVYAGATDHNTISDKKSAPLGYLSFEFTCK